MLATPGKPFSRAGWVFELKYDGYRLFAEKRDGVVTLYSRAGNDYTARVPGRSRRSSPRCHSRASSSTAKSS